MSAPFASIITWGSFNELLGLPGLWFSCKFELLVLFGGLLAILQLVKLSGTVRETAQLRAVLCDKIWYLLNSNPVPPLALGYLSHLFCAYSVPIGLGFLSQSGNPGSYVMRGLY